MTSNSIKNQRRKIMKRFLLSVFVVLVAANFFSNVMADDNPYQDRMVFAVSGELMVYVNFSFEVPSGNCGNLQVYEYQQSYGYPSSPASWNLLAPGTTTYHRGIYLFLNNETECSPLVEISGKPLDTDVYGMWTGLEVEPKDIGVLSPILKSENVFKLSEDDSNFSYILIFNPHGYKTNIGTVLNDPSNFNMHCESAGIIIPDERGFLNESIFWDKMPKKQKAELLKEIIIDRDDVFVNICRENF